MIDFRLLDDKQIFKNNNSNIDFTFLTENQIFDDNQLEILKKYSTKCAITDFSILLGGKVESYCYTIEGNALKDRTGRWWTKTPDRCNGAFYIYNEGIDTRGDVDWHYIGARPAVSYSSIQSMAKNIGMNIYGVKEVQFGEYPQTIVDASYSLIELEMAYQIGYIKTTGKKYTTDSDRFVYNTKSFVARTHTEYEYKGSKYIRFVGDLGYSGEILSDGRKIHNGNIYWIKVEPITWLVDEKANIALAKKILFSGMIFNNQRNYKGDFENTDIKRFIDKYFSKDIKPSKIRSQASVQKQTQKLKKIRQ